MLVCALFFTVTIAALIQIVAGSVLGKHTGDLPKGDVGWGALAPMCVLLGIVFVTGFAVPKPMAHLIAQATTIVTGDPCAAALLAPWQSGDERRIVVATDSRLHTESKR